MPIVKYYTSVPDGSEALVLSPILKGKATLYICSTESKAQRLVEQLSIVSPEINPFYFPAWDCLPYDRVSPGQDVMNLRINILTNLIEQKETYCIVTSIAGLLQRLPPKQALEGQSMLIKQKEPLNRDRLLDYLRDMSYVRVDTVRDVGDYAVRGGIIDFFPTGNTDPVRMDFFGDQIDTLRLFDA